MRFISAWPPGALKSLKVAKEVQLVMPLPPKKSPNGDRDDELKKPNGPKNDVLRVFMGCLGPREWPCKPG